MFRLTLLVLALLSNMIFSNVLADFTALEGEYPGLLLRRSQEASTSSSKKSSPSLGKSLSRTFSKGTGQIPKLLRQASINASKAIVQGSTQIPKLARQASIKATKAVQEVGPLAKKAYKSYEKGQKIERLMHSTDYVPHSGYRDGQYNDHRNW